GDRRAPHSLDQRQRHAGGRRHRVPFRRPRRPLQPDRRRPLRRARPPDQVRLMATTANVRKMPAAATADMLRPSRSLWKDAWYQFRRHTLALAGCLQRLDSPLMRITDLVLSLPILPLLLIIIFLFRDTLRKIFGPEIGIFLMIVTVIGILTWMPVARLVRANFLSLKNKEFVEAARAVGATDTRIITKHILPNVLSSVLVAATLGVGGAIILASTLSFLGL